MININTIKAVAPNATATNKVTVINSTVFTIENARNKVIAKLEDNIAYINNGMKTKNGDKLDLVFKQAGADTYTVGAKYGNRWLKDLFDKGVAYVKEIKQAELVNVITVIKEAVEEKEADDAITAVHKNNKGSKTA